MTLNRSRLYKEIADETTKDYTQPDPRDPYWFKHYAPKWRNRVGIPRLIAENAIREASGLLRSVNPGLFRNDPETALLFGAAVNAIEVLSQEFGLQNWERFEGSSDA